MRGSLAAKFRMRVLQRVVRALAHFAALSRLSEPLGSWTILRISLAIL
jgi:hypothetical protein